jgi:HAD superfamily hydrolase (TIGR01509 family)
MIKAIIFDCWSTLFYKDAPPPASFSERLGVEKTYTLEKVLEKNLMLSPITDVKESFRKIIAELNLKPDEKMVEDLSVILSDKWVNYNKPYPNTLEVLSELKNKKYQLGMVSNASDIVFEPLRKKYRFDEIFDAVVVSFEIGAIKPDSKIFQVCLEKLGVQPQEALMVGDNPWGAV